MATTNHLITENLRSRSNNNRQTMKYHNDLYEGLSFSVPRSIKDKINERARRLRMTRSDYLKTLVLSDLDRGPDAPLEIRPDPRPPYPPSDGSKKKPQK